MVACVRSVDLREGVGVVFVTITGRIGHRVV